MLNFIYNSVKQWMNTKDENDPKIECLDKRTSKRDFKNEKLEIMKRTLFCPREQSHPCMG